MADWQWRRLSQQGQGGATQMSHASRVVQTWMSAETISAVQPHNGFARDAGPCSCAEDSCVQGVIAAEWNWMVFVKESGHRTGRNRDIHECVEHDRSLTEWTSGRGCSHRCCGLWMQVHSENSCRIEHDGNTATCPDPRSSGYWENTHHRVVGPGSASWESSRLERHERVPNAKGVGVCAE